MKKIIATISCTLLLCGALATAGMAKDQPEDVDFGAITCGQFLSEIANSDEDAAGMVLLWLDGYLSGVSGDTVLRWETVNEFSNNIVDACAKQPQSKLLKVARQVGIEQ